VQDQTSETKPSYSFIPAYCLDREFGINFAQNPRSEKFGIYIIRRYHVLYRKVHAIISKLQLVRGRSLWVHSRSVFPGF